MSTQHSPIRQLHTQIKSPSRNRIHCCLLKTMHTAGQSSLAAKLIILVSLKPLRRTHAQRHLSNRPSSACLPPRRRGCCSIRKLCGCLPCCYGYVACWQHLASGRSGTAV